MTLDVAATLGVPHGSRLIWRDLWNPQSTGAVTAGVKNLTFSVPSHAAVVLRFQISVPYSVTLASSHRGRNKINRSGRGRGSGGGRMDFGRATTVSTPPPPLASQAQPALQFLDAAAVTLVSTNASPPAPWPMRGQGPRRSGRSEFHGPANATAGPGIKWNFGNCSAPTQRPCNTPSVYEAIPVVSAVNGGLVLATLSFGNGNQGTYIYALDLETGAQRWNASINGTAWGSMLLAAAPDGAELALYT